MMNKSRLVLALLGMVFFTACSNIGIADEKNSQIRDVVFPILITNGDPNPQTRRILGSGSGVIFAPHYMITAAHVVPEDNTSTLYEYLGEDKEPVLLHVVKIDREADLALLTGDFDCPCASFSSKIPNIDDHLYAVGFPLFGAYKLQILSSGAFQGIAHDHYVTTLIAAPGSSGGGLFIKENGVFKWVGIVEAIGMYKDQIQTWLTFSITNSAVTLFLSGTSVAHYLS